MFLWGRLWFKNELSVNSAGHQPCLACLDLRSHRAHPPPYIVSHVVTCLSWGKDSKKDMCWQSLEIVNRSLSAESLRMRGGVQTKLRARMDQCVLTSAAPAVSGIPRRMSPWESGRGGVSEQIQCVLLEEPECWKNPWEASKCHGMLNTNRLGHRQAIVSLRLTALCKASLVLLPSVGAHPRPRPFYSEPWIKFQLWCYPSCEFKTLICFSKLQFILST